MNIESQPVCRCNTCRRIASDSSDLPGLNFAFVVQWQLVTRRSKVALCNCSAICAMYWWCFFYVWDGAKISISATRSASLRMSWNSRLTCRCISKWSSFLSCLRGLDYSYHKETLDFRNSCFFWLGGPDKLLTDVHEFIRSSVPTRAFKTTNAETD